MVGKEGLVVVTAMAEQAGLHHRLNYIRLADMGKSVKMKGEPVSYST
jgi:hypothetical protein